MKHYLECQHDKTYVSHPTREKAIQRIGLADVVTSRAAPEEIGRWVREWKRRWGRQWKANARRKGIAG